MKKEPRYYIEVRYNSGDIFLTDYYIENLVGREISSSGCGMGWRDLCFDFYYESAAKRAIKRLSKSKKVKVKTTLYKHERDNEY